MNKAGKHIQNGGTALAGNNISAQANGNANANANANPFLSPSASTNGSATSPMNVFNSIMSFLPDNRPITSLHIVEDFERCPKNFNAIHRTYDQDADADLWRETNLLFGRQTTRYLCLSKSEGLPEYVVETLKVISEKVQPPKEFSLLSRTADTDQKAWRKRQIAYKLSKRGTVLNAVTDVILCSKLKIAPDGFRMAGEINGLLICYKTCAVASRLPPPLPCPNSSSNSTNSTSSSSSTFDLEQELNRVNLHGRGARGPLPQLPEHHDYEEIQAHYQVNSPQRPAPPRPASTSKLTAATLLANLTYGPNYEVEGVPFVINTALQRQTETELPEIPEISTLLKELDYDFQLERQILCTMKSSASKNPFFK